MLIFEEYFIQEKSLTVKHDNWDEINLDAYEGSWGSGIIHAISYRSTMGSLVRVANQF